MSDEAYGQEDGYGDDYQDYDEAGGAVAYAEPEEAAPAAEEEQGGSIEDFLAELLAARERFEQAAASLETLADGSTAASGAVTAAAREALALNRMVLAVCMPEGPPPSFGATAMKVLAAADKADPKAQLNLLVQKFAQDDVLRADEHVRLARVFADVGMAQLKDIMVHHGMDLSALPPACMFAEDLTRMDGAYLRAYLNGQAERLEQLPVGAQLVAVTRLCEGMLPAYPDLELAGKLLAAALVVAPPQHQFKVFETFCARISPYHRGAVLVATILAPGLDKLRVIIPEVRVALVQGLTDSLMTREIGRAIGKVLVSLRLDTALNPEARTAADLVRKAVASHDRPMMLAGVVAALPPEELAATGPEQAEGLAAALASGPAEDRQLLMRLLLGLLRAGEDAEMSFLRAFGRAEAADPGKIAPALVRSLTLGEAASLSRGALEVLYQTLVEAGASRVLLRQLEEALA